MQRADEERYIGLVPRSRNTNGQMVSESNDVPVQFTCSRRRTHNVRLEIACVAVFTKCDAHRAETLGSRTVGQSPNPSPHIGSSAARR